MCLTLLKRREQTCIVTLPRGHEQTCIYKRGDSSRSKIALTSGLVDK